jgi:hypothetical protein
MKRAAFELVQYLIAALGVVLAVPGYVLMFVMRIGQLWSRHVYYRWVQLKRRSLGEDAWQEHDMSIGVMPPDGHPFWDKMRRASIPHIVLPGDPP